MTPHELRPLMIEALRGETHQRFCVIWKFDRRQGFCADGDRTPAIVQFIQLHEGWLKKKLKRNAITLHWNDSDPFAHVAVLVEHGTFPQFKLPFPPPKPTLV